ncbi:MAG TPA: DUF3237 family protein, partial [Candidatus Copromorpha excrementipullorum]|nr:DUF3237 family protein [Candidatus Copromorpha excrementipullorum]
MRCEAARSEVGKALPGGGAAAGRLSTGRSRGCTGNPDGVDDYYFRISVFFKAGAEKYRWLNDKVA